MQTLIDLMATLLPLLYALATVNYLVFFVRADPFAEKTCTPFLFGVFLMHVGFFLVRIFTYGRYPITNMGEALSAVSLAVVLVYLYEERLQRSRSTGVFVLTVATVLQLIASSLLYSLGDTPSELAQNPIYGLHAIAAVLCYAAFAVGAVYGVMYLLLYRALKRKNFGLVFERLPPLDVLASMGIGATFIGWALLTATILLGFAMGGLWRSIDDPTTLIVLAVWVVYTFAIGAYFALGWRGARTVYLSLFGFACALMAMVGSAYVWPSYHTFSA
ncbi:MAG: cytochrome c biogenesis protein CcsA [Myxococcota bacterium]